MSAARLLAAMAAVLIVAGLAFGLRAGFGDLLGEPSLEQQTRTLAQQLRCPVCTGQSVAESDSTVANEMRAEIRARLEAGDDPADILASFESRYGAWIINQPPARGLYALVWAGPFVAAGVGAWALGRYLARQRALVPPGANRPGRSAQTPPAAVAESTVPGTEAAAGGAEGTAADAGPTAQDEVAARLKDYL